MDIRKIDENYSEYLRDESRTVGHADTISFPENEADIIDTVKYCRENGIRVTVQGGRTGLAAAAVPFGGHVLNLSRMNRILGMRFDNGIFYVKVMPGVVLSELRKALSSKKFDVSVWDETSLSAYAAFLKAPAQFFAPDPTETSATIGGMASCNASGARTHGYGSTRMHISALRLVLDDGDIIDAKRGDYISDGRNLKIRTVSGRVLDLHLPEYEMPKTKNASGYYICDDMDAVDLIVGSDGTFGVLSEIEVKLIKVPEETWGATCFFKNENDAVSFTDEIRISQALPCAIEYFDERALNILRDQKKSKSAFAVLPEIPADAVCAIYTELHCADENEAGERLMCVGSVLERNGGNKDRSWVARTESDLDKLMFFRHAVPESVNMLIDERKKVYPEITKLGADMSVPDDKLSEVIKLYRTSLRKENLDAASWGHIGENHLHVNILSRNSDEYKRGKELFKVWAQKITEMGGAVSAEHGVGKLKADYLKIMYGETFVGQMARLKREIDPEYMFGAGNLFKEEVSE